MKLSNRLETLYTLIPTDSILVDIGTDHGLLLIRAIESGRCPRAYGVDINQGPLDQAHENLVRYKLEDKVDLILSDGLKGFNEIADCFVLAGMGAETIWEIMTHYHFEDADTIIVQSNTKHTWFRKTVSENGFRIVDEVFMIDKGIPVVLMVLKTGTESLSFSDCVLGPILRHNKSGVYRGYLKDLHTHYDRIKHNQAALFEVFTVLDEEIGKGSSYE